MEEDKYHPLLNTIGFLNEQMSRFESTIEIENAEMNLIENVGEFVNADCVQLIILQNGVFIPRCHWMKEENKVHRNYDDCYVLTSEDTWIKYLQGVRDCIRYDNLINRQLKDFSYEDLYVLPLCYENILDGVLCVYNPDEKQLESFMDIQDLFSHWLTNRIVKKDNRMKKIMSGLGRDYTAAFMINLDTNYFEFLINQKSNNSAREKKQIFWDSYLCNYADKYCVENSKDAMKQELCIATVKQRLEKENEYHFTFETSPNSIGQTCFQAHVAKEYGPQGEYVVIGFRCVDQIIQKESIRNLWMRRTEKHVSSLK